MLLEEATPATALAVAGRLLAALGHPISIHAENVMPSASAGVAASKDGEDARGLLDKAAVALALAKAAGGGHHMPYTADIPQLAETNPPPFPAAPLQD